MQSMTREDITDLSRAALSQWFAGENEAPYRAAQVLRWIYQRGADSFDAMTDIRKDLRRKISERFTIGRPEILDTAASADGSRKFVFGLLDGKRIETVLIPERDHYTLCVSSQVGCAQGCAFCRTGAMGFSRNLKASEIVAQVRAVRFSLPDPERLTNLVFMGMGEPLANFENVRDAVNLLTDPEVGMKFAARRVTVSTVGLAPKIAALGRETRARLAVSLNAADDETRSRLMPVNRVYPIARLLEALKGFPLKTGKRITFEYVLLSGVNDSPADARNLVRILSSVPAKINLIPFNPYEGSPFERPSEDRIAAFHDFLIEKHFTAIIRRSKGPDIAAACGQLAAGA